MVCKLSHWLDERVAPIARAFAPTAARWALGVIFIWFGGLKVVGRSPAAELVAATMPFLPARAFVVTLGVWEVAIGALFLFRSTTWWAIALMVPQMAGTFLPLLTLRDQTFTAFPWAFTLPGQYIVKNLALIALAIGLAGERAADRPDKG